MTSEMDVLETSLREVLRTLHIGQYGDVIRTLHWTSLGRHISTLVGDTPWRCIENHKGTFIGRVLGTSSGHPRDVSLLIGKELLNTSQ